MKPADHCRRIQAGAVQQALDDAEEAVRAIRKASPQDRPARIRAAVAELLELQRQDGVLEGLVVLEEAVANWGPRAQTEGTVTS